MTEEKTVHEVLVEAFGEEVAKEKLKEVGKDCFMQGYRAGQDVEELRDVTIRAAETHFERYWEMNHE